MIFTHDIWEHVGSSGTVSGIADEISRRYRRVYIPLDVQLFHVNIGERQDNIISWRRFIVDDPVELLQLLDEFRDKKITVTMQSESRGNSEYNFFKIKAICRGSIVGGRVLHRFLCHDGTLRYETLARTNLHELINEEMLWSCMI
jgi:hypothetical protein